VASSLKEKTPLAGVFQEEEECMSFLLSVLREERASSASASSFLKLMGATGVKPTSFARDCSHKFCRTSHSAKTDQDRLLLAMDAIRESLSESFPDDHISEFTTVNRPPTVFSSTSSTGRTGVSKLTSLTLKN
jgi:hypothetical protein